MNKGTSLLAALLVLLVGVSAVAKDRKDTWFQQKIKLNPAEVTEHRASLPAERVISLAVPRALPLTPVSSAKGECYLIQDQGTAASYFDYFAAGDAVAMYLDPALYCNEPVYPFKIENVEFPLYDFAGVNSSDITVEVRLVSQDRCNGPGTQIYRSDPVAITDMYPDMAVVELPEPICVWEPFFLSLKYYTGAAGSTPSFMFHHSDFACDTCHAWVWYESGGDSPPWWEWHDFWTSPCPGCPVIRVNGLTQQSECDQAPCDTTLETLWGGSMAAYYWKQPPNDPFMNMSFEMPQDHGGRLEALQVGWYQSGSSGTPDPDFYVWLSDGSFPLDDNPPYQAIADFHIAYADVGWFPSYTEVPAWESGIYFDPGETFHIGFSHAFEPGDTLAILSDDGTLGEQRSSGWTGTGWEDYWPYQFLINAIICPSPVFVPTFNMRCTPMIAYATPGDPPTNLYHIDLTQVLGYSQPITLSLLNVSPPAAVYASFSPNGAPCPYISDAAISAEVGVPYGDYTLTFQAVGEGGQTRTCRTTLTLEPAYDETLVHFYHGLQRTTNFGAIGDGEASQSFVWYGTDYLYDGSLISAVEGYPQEDHMAYQIYDCHCMRFWPTQHLAKAYHPWCPGSAYQEDYGEIAYSNFHTKPSSIPGEHDSLFVVGLTDVECTDFSIIIRIHYNPTDDLVPELWTGVFEDWDVDVEFNDWGHMDTLHNQMWMYDADLPSVVFGILYVPFYDQLCHNMTFVHNPTEVYPYGDSCFLHSHQPGPGYLYRLMTARQYRDMGYWSSAPDDYSILLSGPPFSLNPGEKRVQIWVNFGRDLNDGLTWEQWRHKILRYVGFYRGDVNASDSLELPALDISDLVYMQNYLFRGGPAPLPFADQGNVDGKGPYAGELDFECPKNNVDVQDLVYLLNYVYKGGPPPVDYVRFIPSLWSRPSLFINPYWK